MSDYVHTTEADLRLWFADPAAGASARCRLGACGSALPARAAASQADFAVRPSFAMRGHAIRTPHASAGSDPPRAAWARSQRADGAAWSLRAFDTNSPCVDGRPPLVAGQPEQRRYRARYVDNDLPVGDWSDTVEMTARP